MSSPKDRPAQRFGEIPGAPIGTTWKNRRECFDAGVHRQLEPGISGTEATGAFSIVVSGQYIDDKDEGDTIIYTGSGGHIPSDNVRDQEWSDLGNEALRKSSQTGKPVRVIRGSDLGSEFAPWEGYRYDGLYICKRAWKEKNRDGYYDICRYIMERVPGQPPLRRRSAASGVYKLLPGSEIVQPPAPTPTPAPGTGRHGIRQQIQASLINDHSWLADQ
ncbi:PUA-like domain-containing protein [Suillus bovinus]|uniref:PUA-like domain-containing protein n=1 Tax=Suillus bovinus TaxID=48563 RepID=UPI001B8832B6|nr:PUA-like domain-containing protein [Suillus bovinus]KAG2157927.1 PUA-like domain-containing protein [Suillus bovinus]